MTTIQEGTVIRGTGLCEDIIPALIAVIPDGAERIEWEHQWEIAGALDEATEMELRSRLEDRLNDLAPLGYFFGVVDGGDQSDLGFWSNEYQGGERDGSHPFEYEEIGEDD